MVAKSEPLARISQTRCPKWMKSQPPTTGPIAAPAPKTNWKLPRYQGLRWAGPAIAFLVFMIPWPYRLEVALAHPLQRVATLASTYALQTLGYPAIAEGNHILIDEIRLGVADACSGLGMLMTFFALATAVTLILQPRWLDRVVIVASAIPIALIANVARITLTGVVHVGIGAAAGQFVHDHAGWMMMPLALALLWLELRFLRRLLVEQESQRPLALGLPFAKTLLTPPQPRKPGSQPLPSPTTTSHHDALSETR